MNETDGYWNKMVICFYFFYIICSQSFNKLNTPNAKTEEKKRKRKIIKEKQTYSIVIQFAKEDI